MNSVLQSFAQVSTAPLATSDLFAIAAANADLVQARACERFRFAALYPLVNRLQCLRAGLQDPKEAAATAFAAAATPFDRLNKRQKLSAADSALALEGLTKFRTQR